MRKSSRAVAAFLFVAALQMTARVEAVRGCFSTDPSESDAWYTPLPEDFRPEYSKDAANQRKQTWNQYWGWVKSFYEGSFFCPGWTDRAKGATKVVAAGPARRKVIKDVTDFGKEICKEWAKDASVCKIGTSDLVRWGKVVEKARAKDDGSGEELRRAISALKAEYLKKMKPPAQ
jgi:hypothetical protein